ncbi:phosphoglucomutase/phosphomannomutase family protein [Deinococcus sp. KNUC1210]|uniref:phosphoglucomutase/phosphomannomutase family protein n=1 Tax=Deinococcus sp. KNUC1210 TaxID=2917691 RepID=UPI001EEFCEE6|nr:phosphoglucomutase/phosphomannomutase family protein [Deinococcus sp. KNUC1210]ULH15291.1 phosphoglucomutase/phosphomannomutase family protein [Deinococcus sp. KNUC1210]
MPIKFGTDGWRDIIAQDFTYANVALVAAAHARYLRSQGGTDVVIGYDTRFQGEGFAGVAAAAMSQAGLNVHLAAAYVPTPALSYAVKVLGAAGGVMITASHNPPPYSGYKLKGPYGGSATPAIVAQVEAQVEAAGQKNEVSSADVVSRPGTITPLAVQADYFRALDGLLDLEALRAYRGRVFHDAMGGAGAGWIEAYLKHAALPAEFVALRGEPTPLFYGVNPEPIPQNLEATMQRLSDETGTTFAVVTDGDADRVGAVTAGGEFFNSHQIFAVLLKHLYDKGLRGRVVKTVSGSGIIDRLCAVLGLDVVETPVGFKYITDAFLEGEENPELAVLMGGEESGGLASRGHIPERDGILNGLLLLEAVASSGQSLPQLFSEIETLTGFRHFYGRNDLQLQLGQSREALKAQIETLTELAGHRVERVVTKDGVKLLLSGDAFAMFRFSGTEPVVRVYVEAQTAEDQQLLLKTATALLHV